MNRLLLLALVGGIMSAALTNPHPAAAGDWSQLQCDPQRQGYSPEKLSLPLTSAWSVSFVPERVYPANQPIVSQGRLYLGTESGTLHALDAGRGTKLWAVPGKGPILGAAAAGDGKVFFASMDGNVYAVGATDGQEAWTFRSGLDTGFSTALALGDGKLFAANRGGMVYALDPSSGKELWHYDVGAPLLQSPALLPGKDGKGGRLFIGAMDMRAYAIDADKGQLVWRSERLYGQAFKDYWPVVYRDKVILRSMIAYPKAPISNRTRFYTGENFPLTWADPAPDPAWRPRTGAPSADQAVKHGQWLRQHSEEVARGGIPEEVNAAQDRLTAYYREHPEDRDMFVLDADTGKETVVVPHWCAQTMNGAAAPPCVDRDGLLVVPMMYINGRWGRLDLDKARIVDILYDGMTYSGERVSMLEKPGFYPVAGGGNTDENLIVSAAGDLVFSFHTQEANANYTGVWDMKLRRWHQLGRPQPDSGSYYNNTQGGGASPAVVADGTLYHLSFHTVTAWRTANTPVPRAVTQPTGRPGAGATPGPRGLEGRVGP